VAVATRAWAGKNPRAMMRDPITVEDVLNSRLIAWPMHLLNFSSASSAKWIGFSGFFRFGHPKFEAAAIISMCIVMLVTYTESTADMLAVAEMVDRKLAPSYLARGLATDGLSAVLAGFLNSFPDTAFAEHVGLVGLTRVRSRWVVTSFGTTLRPAVTSSTPYGTGTDAASSPKLGPPT